MNITISLTDEQVGYMARKLAIVQGGEETAEDFLAREVAAIQAHLSTYCLGYVSYIVAELVEVDRVDRINKVMMGDPATLDAIVATVEAQIAADAAAQQGPEP